MDLLAYLQTSKTSIYDDSDTDWVQFVKDHKLIIREQATVYSISVDKMSMVKYDLMRLISEISYPFGCMWMIYIINDFLSDITFVATDNNPFTLYVPDLSSSIPKLYTFYQSSKNSTEVSA